jgi:arginine/ornithine transport system substrate-binding protein
MKKILALSCLFAAFHLQAQPLRIATDVSYPPFSKQNPDGSIVGFDADIARALCDKMKAECELSAHDFDGIIPGLQAKSTSWRLFDEHPAGPPRWLPATCTQHSGG